MGGHCASRACRRHGWWGVLCQMTGGPSWPQTTLSHSMHSRAKPRALGNGLANFLCKAALMCFSSSLSITGIRCVREGNECLCIAPTHSRTHIHTHTVSPHVSLPLYRRRPSPALPPIGVQVVAHRDGHDIHVPRTGDSCIWPRYDEQVPRVHRIAPMPLACCCVWFVPFVRLCMSYECFLLTAPSLHHSIHTNPNTDSTKWVS